MDGGAVPTGDVADDLIAGGRVAAPGHAGQQAFEAENGDRFGGDGVAGGWDYHQYIVVLLCLDQFVDHPGNIEIATAEGNIQLLGGAVELLCQGI